MKILITGITGFVGQYLSRELLSIKANIFGIVRKKKDKDLLEKIGIVSYVDNGSARDLTNFFQEHKFDGVVHLASCYINNHTLEDIPKLADSNITFSTRILESSALSGVRWFINTGTFMQHYENMEYNPVNLYAATKQAFETIAKYYIETQDINVVTIKMHDTYGPGDKRPKIFNLWKENAETGESLSMSPGEQLMDMTYIDDVVSAFVKMINLIDEDKEHIYQGKSFAVSSKERVKLKELAKIFSDISKKELNIMWGGKPYRDRELMKPWDKGEPIPGWKPVVKLVDGIKKTLVLNS